MDFITVRETAVKWNISQRRVQKLSKKAASKACFVSENHG